MKIGYARVSTLDQNADLQHRALKRAGCRTIHEDRLSGRSQRRPGLDHAFILPDSIARSELRPLHDPQNTDDES
ncbi:MAG TPA: recombinase family protein [Candidatus Dormibacteraeota bacterium]|nr:recombinase family protein [Candidatus Dormibacteraeota bacterium]